MAALVVVVLALDLLAALVLVVNLLPILKASFATSLGVEVHGFNEILTSSSLHATTDAFFRHCNASALHRISQGSTNNYRHDS